jgi:hypothetical protein
MGKPTAKVLYDFSTGVTKDATMQKIGITMDKKGLNSGIQEVVNRTTDFSIDMTVKKNEPKN